jgi:hypothetical protein
MNEIIENLEMVSGKVRSFDRALELSFEALSNGNECHGIVAVLSDQDSLISDLAASIERSNVDERVRGRRG